MKKIICCLLSVALLLSMVGCGESAGNKKTITYAVWGGADEIAIIDEMIEGFEAMYSEEGYTVEKVHYASEYYDKIQLSYSGKNEADVMWMQGGIIESYVQNGLIENLQPYIEKTSEEGLDLNESDLWPINDSYRYDSKTGMFGQGDLYGIIKDWSPDYAMIYNKALIDEFDSETGNYTASVKQVAENKLREISATDTQYASLKNTKVVGKTLAEIVGYPTDETGKYPSPYIPMSWLQNELMCFLLTTYNSSGVPEIYGTIFDNDPVKYAQMCAEINGGKIYTDDGKEFNYSSSGTQDEKILQGYQHFINYQYGPLKSANLFGDSATSSDAGFPKGDVAVVWYGRWKFAKPSWSTVNFGIAPPPTKDGGVDNDGDGYEDNGNVYCSSVAISFVMSSRSKNKDLAWKFIEYCMTVGTSATIDKGFNLPGNKTIAKSSKYTENDSAREKYLNNYYLWLADYTHAFQTSKYIDDSTANAYIRAQLSLAATGTLTTAEALRLAGNEINKELAISN